VEGIFFYVENFSGLHNRSKGLDAQNSVIYNASE